MIEAKQIKAIFKATYGDSVEDFQIPDLLMATMLDKPKRELMFKQFLSLDTDYGNLSYDWFNEYFQEVQADHKGKGQDFTPQAISNTVAKLTVNTEGHPEDLYNKDGSKTCMRVEHVVNVLEPAAGSGGMLITDWWQRYDGLKWQFHPALVWYDAWELAASTIPFLIFNMAIRGMNGVIIHGNTLDKTAKAVYYLRNQGKPDTQKGIAEAMFLNKALGVDMGIRLGYDDPFKFSDVFVMPKSDDLKEFLNIKEWID